MASQIVSNNSISRNPDYEVEVEDQGSGVLRQVVKVAETGATALTPSSPTAASVGTSSGQIVAANSSRKGLVLINTSNEYISLGLGATAVLYSGITLAPDGAFTMTAQTLTTGAINAIAGGASSNLAIQEFS